MLPRFLGGEVLPDVGGLGVVGLAGFDGGGFGEDLVGARRAVRLGLLRGHWFTAGRGRARHSEAWRWAHIRTTSMWLEL